MATDSNKVILKANLPRTRDLSFVGRFHHNFGFEDDLFEFLLDQKDLWGDKLFYLNEKQFSRWTEQGKQKVREVPIVSEAEIRFPSLAGNSMLDVEFTKSFGKTCPIHINFSKEGKSVESMIEKGDCVSIKSAIDRNGLALNVGGFITAMKWLPYGSSPYLAVSVINSDDGLALTISNPSLSIFPKKEIGKDVKSCIQFWRYNPDAKTLKLASVIYTSTFGVTAELTWLPIRVTGGVLGVLCGAFSDGRLHFFKIEENQGETTSYLDVKKPSWTISVTDERGSSPEAILPITAHDFLEDNKIVVGTIDGAIAEFVLPTSGNDGEDELHIPSFVEYVADSCINSITLAGVNGSHVILINTATTQAFSLQYEQLRQGRVESSYTVSFLKPLYHRSYRIFVYPDSAESIGYSFVRHPHQKQSLLLRTELISTFHISEYLNHPFAIVGNSLGDVYVINIGRKIFGVPKAHNKLVVPLKLWSLTLLPDGKTYDLCGDYVPTSAEKSDIMYTFSPPEVVISASAWNENFDGSSTYAFGTYTGLLVLERLDPLTS